MSISVFDLFKTGIGASSSHTVGPMKAAQLYRQLKSGGGRLAVNVLEVPVSIIEC